MSAKGTPPVNRGLVGAHSQVAFQCLAAGWPLALNGAVVLQTLPMTGRAVLSQVLCRDTMAFMLVSWAARVIWREYFLPRSTTSCA